MVSSNLPGYLSKVHSRQRVFLGVNAYLCVANRGWLDFKRVSWSGSLKYMKYGSVTDLSIDGFRDFASVKIGFY